MADGQVLQIHLRLAPQLNKRPGGGATWCLWHDPLIGFISSDASRLSCPGANRMLLGSASANQKIRPDLPLTSLDVNHDHLFGIVGACRFRHTWRAHPDCQGTRILVAMAIASPVVARETEEHTGRRERISPVDFTSVTLV